MFSWHSDADKKILKGEAPFEFRVLEKPIAEPLTCLPSEWIDFIDKHRGREPYSERLTKKNEEATKGKKEKKKKKTKKGEKEKQEKSCIVS